MLGDQVMSAPAPVTWQIGKTGWQGLCVGGSRQQHHVLTTSQPHSPWLALSVRTTPRASVKQRDWFPWRHSILSPWQPEISKQVRLRSESSATSRGCSPTRLTPPTTTNKAGTHEQLTTDFLR
jgi:hypothetical protein